MTKEERYKERVLAQEFVMPILIEISKQVRNITHRT
jgi:hypothetical protein